MQKCNTLFAS